MYCDNPPHQPVATELWKACASAKQALFLGPRLTSHSPSKVRKPGPHAGHRGKSGWEAAVKRHNLIKNGF